MVSSNVINFGYNPGFTNNEAVVYYENGGSTLTGLTASTPGLTPSQIYYVEVTSATQVQLFSDAALSTPANFTVPANIGAFQALAVAPPTVSVTEFAGNMLSYFPTFTTGVTEVTMISGINGLTPGGTYFVMAGGNTLAIGGSPANFTIQSADSAADAIARQPIEGLSGTGTFSIVGIPTLTFGATIVVDDTLEVQPTENFTTGEAVSLGSASLGLSAGTYYVIAVNNNTVALANSLSNANIGLALPLAAGTGTLLLPLQPQNTRSGSDTDFLDNTSTLGSPSGVLPVTLLDQEAFLVAIADQNVQLQAIYKLPNIGGYTVGTIDSANGTVSNGFATVATGTANGGMPGVAVFDNIQIWESLYTRLYQIQAVYTNPTNPNPGIGIVFTRSGTFRVPAELVPEQCQQFRRIGSNRVYRCALCVDPRQRQHCRSNRPARAICRRTRSR